MIRTNIKASTITHTSAGYTNMSFFTYNFYYKEKTAKHKASPSKNNKKIIKNQLDKINQA